MDVLPREIIFEIALYCTPDPRDYSALRRTCKKMLSILPAYDALVFDMAIVKPDIWTWFDRVTVILERLAPPQSAIGVLARGLQNYTWYFKSRDYHTKGVYITNSFNFTESRDPYERCLRDKVPLTARDLKKAFVRTAGKYPRVQRKHVRVDWETYKRDGYKNVNHNLKRKRE